MALKREYSVMGGLAVAAIVGAVYQGALPNLADARSLPAGNDDLAKSERVAGWTAAGITAGVSLIAQDPTIFIIGGSMVIALSWWHRHANQVHPQTGTTTAITVPQTGQSAAPQDYSAPTEAGFGVSF